MKEIFFASLFLASMGARAHFEIGTYKGTTVDGAECNMLVKGVTFNYNIKNPLNEKVEVEFNNETFFIGHAPLFDAGTNQVNVDFETLVANKGTETGGKHFSLHMEHERKNEGPTSFFMVDHNWKTSAVSKIECLNLEFVGK